MKLFIVEYTRDYGRSYKKKMVLGTTLTDAYVQADLRLPEDAQITGIFEVYQEKE